jgi:antitoxin HigA-1
MKNVAMARLCRRGPRNAPHQKCRFSRKTNDKMIPFVHSAKVPSPIMRVSGACNRPNSRQNDQHAKKGKNGALNNLVNCKSEISADMALRLDKAFGGGAETWLRLQVAYDLAQARQHECAIKVKPVARRKSVRTAPLTWPTCALIKTLA